MFKLISSLAVFAALTTGATAAMAAPLSYDAAMAQAKATDACYVQRNVDGSWFAVQSCDEPEQDPLYASCLETADTNYSIALAIGIADADMVHEDTMSVCWESQTVAVH